MLIPKMFRKFEISKGSEEVVCVCMYVVCSSWGGVLNMTFSVIIYFHKVFLEAVITILTESSVVKYTNTDKEVSCFLRLF